MSACELANPALREVRLYGELGRRFGRVFHLAVSTPVEAVHALTAVLPGFKAAFLGRNGRTAYHVFVGRKDQRRAIAQDDKDAPVGVNEPIRFVPEVAGAKRAGTTNVIVGYVLYVVGAVISIYSGGTYGALGSAMMKMGESMILGGVIQLLSPQRTTKDKGVENQPSYAFDGPVNITEQGGPVPLAYGTVVCGSTVVSQGLDTTEIVIPPPAPLPDLPPVPWEDQNPGGPGDGDG